eukprot:1352830-Alexandrium_andersonii.AAC.1
MPRQWCEAAGYKSTGASPPIASPMPEAGKSLQAGVELLHDFPVLWLDVRLDAKVRGGSAVHACSQRAYGVLQVHLLGMLADV